MIEDNDFWDLEDEVRRLRDEIAFLKQELESVKRLTANLKTIGTHSNIPDYMRPLGPEKFPPPEPTIITQLTLSKIKPLKKENDEH